MSCEIVCSETVGNFLSSEYGIIFSILKNIPMKELQRMSLVCKTWNQAVKQIKKERIEPDWFLWMPRFPSSYMPSCSNLASGGEDNTASKAANTEAGAHEEYVDLFNPFFCYFSKVFKEMLCEPRICLLFVTEYFFSSIDYKNWPNNILPKGKNSVVTLLSDAFPKHCQVYGIETSGIIGSFWRSSEACEEETVPSIAALLFPKIPNLEIYPFVINESCDIRRDAPITEDIIYDLTQIPKDKNVKALIFFCNSVDRGGKGATIVSEFYNSKESNCVAIGGGFGGNVILPPHMKVKCKFAPYTVGCAFAGEYVKAASIVISRQTHTMQGVERRIRELKQADLYPTKIAFMFACVGRGFQLYDEVNVESKVFQKVFPGVPVFGFFGEGEIGTEYIPNAQKSNTSKKRRKYDLYHQYTTIFVVISYKS